MKNLEDTADLNNKKYHVTKTIEMGVRGNKIEIVTSLNEDKMYNTADVKEFTTEALQGLKESIEQELRFRENYNIPSGINDLVKEFEKLTKARKFILKEPLEIEYALSFLFYSANSGEKTIEPSDIELDLDVLSDYPEAISSEMVTYAVEINSFFNKVKETASKMNMSTQGLYQTIRNEIEIK